MQRINNTFLISTYIILIVTVSLFGLFFGNGNWTYFNHEPGSIFIVIVPCVSYIICNFIMQFYLDKKTYIPIINKIIITWVLPIIPLAIILYFNKPVENIVQKRINTFETYYTKQIQILINHKLLSKNISSYQDTVFDIKNNISTKYIFNRPYIIVYDRCNYIEDTINNCQYDLASNWKSTLFEKSQIDNIYSLRNSLILKKLECNSIFLIKIKNVISGRRINLDVGDVPEVLKLAEVYGCNLDTDLHFQLLGSFRGLPAELPTRHLGGGVINIDTLVGVEPDLVEIDNYIKKYIKH